MWEPRRAGGGFNLWGLCSLRFRFFVPLGEVFSKLKLAERALLISESIIPTRPLLAVSPMGSHLCPKYQSLMIKFNQILLTFLKSDKGY